jgi:hypothetical protein
MRFGDVDDQERDLSSVLFVELVEGRNLPPERRSSVASKYEHYWLSLHRERGQLYLCALVQLRQRKVRGAISHLQSSRAGVRPQSFKWKDEKCDGSRYSGHHLGKFVGRLLHHREQTYTGKRPQHSEHDQRS